MKRLAVFCDGTWQKPSLKKQTNVVKMARVLAARDDDIPQLVYYDPGVGTTKMMRFVGGAFGRGLNTNIAQAYLFLCLNYDPGDEVYLFGFSRGAFTVRSLSGLIYCSGLLKREGIRSLDEAIRLYRSTKIKPSHETAYRFRRAIGDRSGGVVEEGRIPIRFLGCWDTVGSMGIPNAIPQLPLDRLWNRRYRFHDTFLNRSIEFAAHAVAVDEPRKAFDFTPMEVPEGKAFKTVLRQTWFPGVHGSVGGGSDANTPLADRPLQWMMQLASGEDDFKNRKLKPALKFDLSQIPKEQQPDPDPLAPFDGRVKFPYSLLGRKVREIGKVSETNTVDRMTIEKLARDPDYVPSSLDPVRKELEPEVEKIRKKEDGK